MLPEPRNALLYQTLALCRSEVNQQARCTVEVRRDAVPVGSGATLLLCWADATSPVAVPLTSLISRDPNADTLGLAADLAGEVAAWFTAQGWIVRDDPAERSRLTLEHAPSPLWQPLDATSRSIAEKRLTPYLSAIQAEGNCLIVHEYSYETRGGLTVNDEVALRWGKQARVMHSAHGDRPESMESLFPDGERAAGQLVGWLLERGWQVGQRDRQWQGMATLSNEASTNLTITVPLTRKKRFGWW